MPRPVTGSIYRTRTDGLGIRWPENGAEQRQAGFRTRTEAREWFDRTVRPRLRRGGPSATITFDEFADLYLERWGADVTPRTRTTIEEWLAPARRKFGAFTLAELEGAADDIAAWRARLGSDDRKHKATRALRQVLAAAVRWRYLETNPAVDAGRNPQPRADEIRPFTPGELAAILLEIAPRDQAIVTLAAETGLRTNEWPALERRDVSRQDPPSVAVARRYSNGTLTPYPKTGRRIVPLTPRALDALDLLPPRLDTPLLIPGDKGGHLNLNNWRNRVWYPALDAAGVEQRGPYHLRHTFATEALAAGVPMIVLAKWMGNSTDVLELHYGHVAKDSMAGAYALLAERSRVVAGSATTANGTES
jgi:integrase